MTLRPTPSTISRPSWLPHEEYPFTLRTASIDAETVTYVDEGEGPILLFVHTGLWSFVFRDVISRLSTDFRCVTLDFPGHGLSPEPERGPRLNLEEQAELLAGFVDQLGLSDVTLVLHDLGGPVGFHYAATNPERVVGFVMANTFAWEPDHPGLQRMLRIASSAPLRWLDWMTGIIPRMSTTGFGVGRHLSRAGKRAFRGPFRDRRRIGRFHRLIGDALSSEDLFSTTSRRAAELRRVPMLSIFGERNDPFGFQVRHESMFDESESVVIAGGNHFPMMDDPDLFADAVADWWHRRVGKQPPRLLQADQG